MTTALTANSAAEQLLAEVRLLLARHDGADTVDQLAALVDELGAIQSRARGRVRALRKREQDAAPEQPQPAAPLAASPVEPSPVTPPPVAENPPVARRRSTGGTVTTPASTPRPNQQTESTTPAPRPWWVRYWWLISVLLLIVVVSVSQIGGGPDEDDAAVQCRLFVEDQLRSPGTADFHAATATEIGEGRWTVAGSVDAENVLGGTRRVDYQCEMTVAGDTWTLIDLQQTQR